MNKANHIFDLTIDRVPWDRYILFRKVFYGLLLLLSCVNLVGIESFYGESGLIYKDPVGFNGTSHFLLNLLSFSWLKNWYWLFVIGQLISLLASYLDKFKLISSVLIWFFTVNLINRAGVIFTGGEVLVKLLLFFMIFIQVPKTEYKSEFNKVIRNVLNNVFFAACLIQVVFVYLFSSWFKWLDPNWRNGNAIMYISNIDAYSVDWIRDVINDNPWVGKWSTYGSLIYQTLFPILIWFKKSKPYLLVVGVIFHLGIAFGMGIFSFGMIMIVCYLLFFRPNFFSKPIP